MSWIIWIVLALIFAATAFRAFIAGIDYALEYVNGKATFYNLPIKFIRRGMSMNYLYVHPRKKAG